MPHMPAEQRDRVRSLERALDVLEAIGSAGELGVSEVSARTDLGTSTAHRLMATLADRGYLSQNTANGRYALGAKVLELAKALDVRTSALRSAARPHLERVSAATGESANLVVLDGRRVIYVDQVEGSHSVRMFTELGSTALAHTTGSGKAILAYQPSSALVRLYPPETEPLEGLTPHTLRTLAALEEDFARIRRRGYGLDNEEHEEGVSCVATPVFDASGAPIAAISLSGPASRIVRADTGELGALLHRHAAEISEALGYRAQPGAAAG
jgi:IclR family acetate operon transcriptional repressor